ncbi:MAG TPA: hypothetical protein VGP40_00645, partial [Chthoniobacterales bacterium]|nr:hypothetical protein [Chthoniobacterales bacterium]
MCEIAKNMPSKQAQRLWSHGIIVESVAAEVLLPAGGVVRTQTLLEAARRVCREHAKIPIVCRIST